MKNRTLSETNSTIIRTAARMMLTLMLTIAMVAPMAAPADVFAATKKTADSSATAASGSDSAKPAASSGTDSAKADTTETSSKSNYTTSSSQTAGGYNLYIDREVINEKRYSVVPTDFRAEGKRNCIELTWTAPSKQVRGYYILKKDLTGDTWRRIATVTGDSPTKYTDTTADQKDTFYQYTIVSYKKVSGKIMISEPLDWAGAVTSRSSAKNLETVTVTNPANASIVMVGSCAKPELKFDDKAYSTEIRWSSSNNQVATVDATGLITGVSAGTADILMKTHTGAVTSFPVKVSRPGTAQAMIDTFSAWMGYSRINGKQHGIIDIYNSILPWPAGYKMKYSDAWCDATISAAAIKTGCVDKIGRECSVPRHIKIFQALGIWQEDGTITPRPGDIIVYSWGRFRQPNNASASHIGLVVKVEGNQITCIEGNRGIGIVATREIPVGWGCIRGYAQPNYAN